MPEPVPQKPYRQFSFTNHQVAQPTVPLPGNKVDADLDHTNQSVRDLIDFTRQAIADDGRIKAGAIDTGGLPAGPQGPSGPRGDTGAQGPQGPSGPQGTQGNPGIQGTQGIQGAQGVAGQSFVPDAVGPASEKSDYDGEPQGFAFLDSTNGWLWFKESNANADWSPAVYFGRGLPGPIGPQGIQGEQGPEGIQGVQGIQGIQGIQGVAGEDGAVIHNVAVAPGTGLGVVGDWAIRDNGDVYEKTGPATWTLRLNIMGPQGDQGDTGPQGPAGAQGIQGIQGDAGPQGPAGPTGPAGSTDIVLPQTWSSAQKAQAQQNIGLPAPRANLIVNPRMQISQENGNSAGTTSNYFAADQFSCNFVTSTGALSIQRVQSVTPRGSKDRLRVSVTTADTSIAAGEYAVINTKIEGNRVAHLRYGAAGATQIVIRFGWKSPAGTYAVAVRNSAANRSYVTTFTIGAGQANVDTEQTVSIPGDTTGTWLKDSGVGLDVFFVLMSGSTYQTTADAWQAGGFISTSTVSNGLASNTNVFELFDVGLYADPDGLGIAPAWVPNDEAFDLRECLRYYWKMVGSNTFFFRGTAGGASYTQEWNVFYPVPMRAEPVGAIVGSWSSTNINSLTLLTANGSVFSCLAALQSASSGDFYAYTNSADDGLSFTARL